MLPTMAARERKTSKKYQRPNDKTDVFARLDRDVAERLDAIISGIVPATTRSKVIAMLVRQYVEEHEEHEGHEKGGK